MKIVLQHKVTGEVYEPLLIMNKHVVVKGAKIEVFPKHLLRGTVAREPLLNR
jgi:hypothetical protein